MTKKEFLMEYSGLEVKFVMYFKHKFQYVGVHNNKRITVMLGDEEGDIYNNKFLPTERICDYGLLGWLVEEKV